MRFSRAISAGFQRFCDHQSAMAGLAALCIVCLAPAPHARADETIQVAGLLDLLKERLKRAEKPEDDAKEDRKTKKKTKSKQKPERTTKQEKKTSTARLRIAVVGDSLAQDLWFGMRRVLIAKKDIEVVRFTKSASGLVRDDSYDWIEKLTGFVEEERFEIAVVMFGGNDRQNIRVNGKRLPRLSKKWIVEYGNRIDAVVDLLKTRTETVFWVGLPVVRSNRLTRDYKKMNQVFKSRAAANGIEYINIWPLFRGKDGAYSSFGPDLKGAKRRLRMDDGTHFTAPGQGRFANEVVKIMRKTVQLSSAPRFNTNAALLAAASVD